MKPYIFSQTNVFTDRYKFPYPYFWRGDYRSEYPHIYDREAGFAPRFNNSTKPHLPEGCIYYPNHCFTGPPSTQYPCYPECTQRYKSNNPYFLRPSKNFTQR